MTGKKADKLVLYSLIISIIAHSFLLTYFYYKKLMLEAPVESVEITLNPETLTAMEDKTKKPEVEGEKKSEGAQYGAPGGVKVKGDQPVPQIAKGDKPATPETAKEKGPIGAEISNQGAPNGADKGWTWGGDNFSLAKNITPQNRISKERSFSVKGEAEIIVKADFAHFHVYITGNDITVSENTKPLGEINAIRDTDIKIDNFKQKFGRAFLNRLKFTMAKEGDPYIQHVSEVIPQQANDPQILHHFVCRQKINVTTDNKFIDEMLKTVAVIGGSFSPINKKIYASYKNSTLYYDKDMVVSEQRDGGTTVVLSETEDAGSKAARQSGTAMGAALKGGSTSDDEKGAPGQESFLTFSIKNDARKKYEDQVFKAALDDAKAKAIKMSKELGIPIKDAVPLIERTITYTVKKDYSGTLLFKGSIILYY